MKFTGFCKVVKIENFHQKNIHFFFFVAQNIDCGYTLEQPQSMLWIKRKIGIPLYTPVRFKGVCFSWTCFRVENGKSGSLPENC